MSDLREQILDHVQRPNYQPVKPAVIAKKLGLAGDAAHEVKKTIKRLVKENRLAYGPSHLVFPQGQSPAQKKAAKLAAEKEKAKASFQAALAKSPSALEDVPNTERIHHIKKKLAKKPTALRDERQAKTKHKSPTNHVVGTFRKAAAGFGFVRPEGTLRSEGRDADVFIPMDKTGDAAEGDIVSVRLEKRGRMGKIEGRIIDVIERATSRFVGVYFEQAGMGLVQIDGKLFQKPIYVGDPGAKGARVDDKVVIDMVRFPSHSRDGEGVIVDILGQRGEPGVDTQSIIHEFNLPGEFDDDALDDARAQAEKFDESIPKGRRDLTAEVIVTIDPVDARDFDDAISLEKNSRGHWMLGVHIADVSHFVQPKSPLDREAHDRATSIYLPDRVIPMLPEIISNNLASLQPDRVRYALTAMMEMTPEGVLVATDVYKSAIKSRRRFTYEEVDEYLADRTAWKKKLTPEVHGLLARMHELAMILRARRFARGALELSMPEIKIDLDKDGRVTGAHLEKNTESHQIIEEFMLSANEAVAQKLDEAELIFLRRVHGNPDPRKQRVMTEFVRELGFEVENLENRFELQKLLDEVKGDPREHAVNYSVLRSMQRAVYSPEDEGHYALASENYCHFTSPIRRYPDLTVHRLIDQLARKKQPVQRMDDLLVLGDHCSEREQRAADAERELNKVKLLHFLENKIGMELDGVITGTENFGLFVTGTELPAEGFIHISSLTDDYYRFDRARHAIEGHRSGSSYRLGDAVRVAVAAVDVDARSLDFRLVARVSGGKRVSVHMPARSRSSLKDELRGGRKKGGRPTKGKGKPAKGKQRKAKPGGQTKRSR
ncbi:MAG: ribonuclease R [Pirellulales bacterium]